MQKTILLLSAIFFSNFILAQPQSNLAATWLNKNCIPVKYVKAENSLDDLNPLKDLIGDARIVSLGECTHGSSEIFSMKHRMLEYLVKEKGFTIFSIEANMPEAYALNEYIVEGKGDPRKLMAGMHFWTWNTQEVLDMIEWMKKYNETAKTKIQFTGFDMQFTVTASKLVRAYLNSKHPDVLYLLNEYDSVIEKKQTGKNESPKNYARLKTISAMLFDTLSAINTNNTDNQFNWVLQNAKILNQFSGNFFGKPSRDESMAENIRWILDNNPGQKIVLWAHNEHIRMQKDKFGVVRMGNYLKDRYGDSLISIGFSTEEGTYTAATRGKGVDSSNILIPSQKKSCEYIFKQVAIGNFIVDLRNLSKTDERTSWFFNKTNIRMLGAIKNDKFQFYEVVPAEDFDMLLFLRRTSSSRCFNISTEK